MAAFGRGLITVCCASFALGAGGSALAADLSYGFGTAPKATVEDWYLTIGVSGRVEPDYPGSDGYTIRPGVIFSIDKASQLNTFRSVDDNPSIALFDTGTFRIGAVGRLDWGRDDSDSDRLTGLGDIGTSVEGGGFTEWYALPWLRLRAELRYGVGGFSGVTGDLAADAIYTMDRWRFAVGPRLSYAGSGYMSTYFGVTPLQSATATLLGNPLPVFNAGGGFDLVGVTGQLTYNFRNGFEAGMFGGYGYLLGDAASSPLTSDSSQFRAGLSLSYTFNIGKAWW
ncbi:MipA/OmpV family protein [Xanthobacter agilis]|uniref:Outer membrane scaffolding protein for murein synthesis (MipA/OmpV family) n=1 Tax=Xanthobacter agilis TaxID=47492 RepID=A0ABU0LBS3_XANAG|nr:MipA/OmpV family protein [Xanthobacter agilis]MDQ0504588.1 outer membrane scaffolding protein for murein synthesis (MipA/OmpV family) [Xanthobacter agilis]